MPDGASQEHDPPRLHPPPTTNQACEKIHSHDPPHAGGGGGGGGRGEQSVAVTPHETNGTVGAGHEHPFEHPPSWQHPPVYTHRPRTGSPKNWQLCDCPQQHPAGVVVPPPPAVVHPGPRVVVHCGPGVVVGPAVVVVPEQFGGFWLPAVCPHGWLTQVSVDGQ